MHRLTPNWIFAGAGIVFLILYAPSITIPPAGDDWLLIHPAQKLVREKGMWGALLGAFSTPIYDFYRPIALIPSIFSGSNLAFYQALKLVTMILFARLIFGAGCRLGIGPGWALMASVVTLLHQVFVSVVTEVDLWGDLISGICFVALIDVVNRFARRTVPLTRLFLIVPSVTAVCLLSKEAGVTCFLVPLFYAVLMPTEVSSLARRQLLYVSGVSFLIALAYMYVRHVLSLPSSGESEYYALSFGFNIVTNCGLAVAALLNPVNTVDLALGSIPLRILAVLLIGIVGGIALTGFREAMKKRQWRLPVFLLLIAGVAQGPAFLMPHLTEANAARSLGIGWLALAACYEQALQFQRLNSQKKIIVVVAIAWIAFDLSAVFEKSRDIVTGQWKVHRYRTELVMQVAGEPVETVHIAALDPGYKGYSVYSQPLLHELKLGEIPFGVSEMLQPRMVQSDLIIVKNKEEALAKQADYLVDDEGRVEKLSSH